MPNESAIREMLHASLEDVFTKLYPATFLKWLFNAGLETIAQAHPDKLPQLEASQRYGKASAPKKTYLIELLLAVFRDKDMLRPLFYILPEATRKALAVLTWEGVTQLDQLEAMVGEAVCDLNPQERRWYYEPFLLHNEHGFLGIIRTRERRWRHYSERDDAPEKEDHSAVLPRSIRRALKKVIPAPHDYNLLPLDEIKDGSMRYNCEGEAVRDMQLVAEYIQQGHLKYTKAEKITKGCVKAIRSMTQGAPFFPDPDDRDLELLRTRLLVGVMAFAGNDTREKLLKSPDAHPVKKLFKTVTSAVQVFDEELQDHIGRKGSDWLRYDPKGAARLQTFFAKLPAGKWVSFQNIQRYHELRELEPTLFLDSAEGLDARVSQRKDSWDRRLYIDPENIFELVCEPLLKGYAFFLAALGMAELAYDLPSHQRYTRSDKNYLTPFDGLQGVRLTPLGEYVLGKRKTYKLESEGLTHAVVVLDMARLLATCPQVDPLTELAIKQFMETIAAGRYRMTHKSLLGGCASKKELEERIQLFRRVIAAEPPAVWERFFEKSLSRIAPLNPEPERVVLRIDGDDEIRRLFASDPVLRQHCLKVEGLRIAVERKALKTISKRLQHFGYLCPLSSIQSCHDASSR